MEWKWNRPITKDLLKHHWKKLYSSSIGSVNLYSFFNAAAGRMVFERGRERTQLSFFNTSWVLNPYLKTTLDFRPKNFSCNYIKQLKKKKKLVNDVQHK